MKKEFYSMFDTFHQWKVCAYSGLKSLAWGLWRIVTCLIIGLMSIIRWLIHVIEDFASREPIAMIIIVALTSIISAGWMMTFVDSRAKIKHAQYQRDSMSVKLDMYLQAYENGDIIVINQDTIIK